MPQQKIVIIGAGGMLGQALSQVLAEYQPILWRHNDVDITQRDAVLAAVQVAEPDVIINAAAYTAVDLCETNEAVANLVNGTAVGYLAEAAKQVGAKLMHYSTDYVFSGTQVKGYQESDLPTIPVNAYGRSKLLGEQAIQAQVDATWKDYYIIRTAWLYGPGGKNFIDTILQLATTKPELKVVADQHGSPTYTLDLAAQTKVLCTGRYQSGIYHITNSGQCTWFEFAQQALQLAGCITPIYPCTSAEFPRPAQRPQYSILLNTKLPPLPVWSEALQRYLNYSKLR